MLFTDGRKSGHARMNRIDDQLWKRCVATKAYAVPTSWGKQRFNHPTEKSAETQIFSIL